MQQTAELRRQSRPFPRQGPGVRVTWEQACAFLDSLEEHGYMPSTVENYRRNLKHFFQKLPPDQEVDAGSMDRWREQLLTDGYMPQTVNQGLATVSCSLRYLGLRECQSPERVRRAERAQPELTRTEYLRLLSTARALGQERTYLLIKVFAATGLMVQELPLLTAEAVAAGQLDLPGPEGRTVPLPGCLRRELSGYLGRQGILSGPVFVARGSRPMVRSVVTSSIQQLARDARVPSDKCNPRCLRKLYQATQREILEDMAWLLEQRHEQLLEQEALLVGWSRDGPEENAPAARASPGPEGGMAEKPDTA